MANSKVSGEPAITEDEKKVLSIVKTMLDETEFAVPFGEALDMSEIAGYLNRGVLRVWATIFKGAQTWAIVDVIGSSPEYLCRNAGGYLALKMLCLPLERKVRSIDSDLSRVFRPPPAWYSATSSFRPDKGNVLTRALISFSKQIAASL